MPEAFPSRILAGVLPPKLPPMLAADGNEPFDSPDHIFEVWWDGIRAMALAEGGRVTLRGRSQQDLTPYFPDLASRLERRVHGDGVVLDGIITAPDPKGVPRFGGLLKRLHGRDEASRGVPVIYQVFDILYREHRPILRYPLLRRKHALRESLDPDDSIQLGHYEENAGVAFFEAATRLGLPGMVAKQKASPYLAGRRDRSWLQVIAGREANVVVGGYTLSETGRKEPFGSLFLGVYTEEGLRYAGTVSGGFDAEDMPLIYALLNERHAERCPFLDVPRPGRLLYWCQPTLVANVSYGALSSAGQLQFAIFKGLRLDADPRNCTLERLRAPAAS